MAEISPDLFINSVLGYQKTAALKAALALDLFTVISQTDGDLERVAAQTGASVRGVRMLCDYLTVQGFLEKDKADTGLPSNTTFLTKTSPAWIGSVVDFLAAPEMTSLWLERSRCLREEGRLDRAREYRVRSPRMGEIRRSDGPLRASRRGGLGRKGCGMADPAAPSARYRGRARHLRHLGRASRAASRSHRYRLEGRARRRAEERASRRHRRSLPHASRKRLRGRLG